MQRYRVLVPEIRIREIFINAESADDALKGVQDGEGDPGESTFQGYDDSLTWEVDEDYEEYQGQVEDLVNSVRNRSQS